MSNLNLFYHAHSTNLVMMQVATFDFFFNFGLNLHIIFEMVTKFLVKKLFNLEVISQKPKGGGLSAWMLYLF